ncbi:hypothetical protein GCM10009416_40080 [Craurococcus roseus]|uniref:AzlD domain-containing protein n=1 Tax=Craurococcus roseus TaxID=77585 RepID=A0ABN1FU30_9PROT
MTLRPDVLAAILAMAVATFLCRAGGYAVLRVVRPPRFVQAMLNHLPGAIFIAFLVPALAGGGWTAWAAAAATVAAQIAFRRIAVSIAAGVLSLWLLRAATAGAA